MKVELSERSWQTVENLVKDGTYATVEAAVAAAIEGLESDWDGIDVSELLEQERRSRAEGTFREADDAYTAEIRSRAQAIIDSKARR